MPSELDAIWKALSDKTRREILKLLRERPLGTTKIAEAIPHLTRFGVMKHIGVLREAGLIKVRKDGTRRLNTLNVVPIRQVYDELVHGYQDIWAGQLTGLKRELESQIAEASEHRGDQADESFDKADPT
ncbi:MAG: helix-turn-helix domain-containing protein [Deltaproteobacteria bacterium]|nr:helix-turn-helix domain-containing protein [Deltaproteobacteria bacterium]